MTVAIRSELRQDARSFFKGCSMVRAARLLLPLAAFGLTILAIAEEPAKPIGPGFDIANIDKAADPCVDFYQFACGGWLARNPVPADMPMTNRGFDLMMRNQETLRQVLEKAPAGSKLGDSYSACMDEAAIEGLGPSPLQPSLDRIAALKAKDELPALVAHLHQIGVGALFAFGSEQNFADATQMLGWLDQGGIGLPERDFYLRDDPKSTDLRQAYTAHVAKMLALVGDAPEAAAANAARVVEMETALAKASLGRLERRDPAKLHHLMTRKELAAASPAFAWDRYFTAVGAPAFETLNVAAPDFVKGLSAQIEATDLASWKTYLRWYTVHDVAHLLPKAYVDENFAFYRTLSGARELRPRWKRCVQYVEGDMGEELAQGFVASTFGSEGRKRTLQMVQALEAALEKDIRDVAWMSDATEKEALVKLRAIRNKIGHPERWRDYSALEIKRGDALGNSQRAAAFELRRQLGRIGKPVDRDEWPFPPTIVQAGYEPLLNQILFTAAILQPPFYENRQDDAVNFGAIGAVIGHELSHGFDDQGRKFDSAGNMRDWWATTDAAEFEKRAACFVEQYGGYTAVADIKLDGKITLGENIGDNGGVRLAYRALLDSLAGKPASAPIDGYTTEQRFFLGYGQIACENRTEQMARMRAQTGVHSPGQHRVNGVVSNMPEFAKAFGCKAGQPMVREPMCRVW